MDLSHPFKAGASHVNRDGHEVLALHPVNAGRLYLRRGLKKTHSGSADTAALQSVKRRAGSQLSALVILALVLLPIPLLRVPGPSLPPLDSAKPGLQEARLAPKPVVSKPLQDPPRSPSATRAELDDRAILLEELILGLAGNRSLDDLREQILALYPELAADLPSVPIQNRADSFRSAALHFYLRQELISAALSEYRDRTALRLGSE